MGRDFLPEEDKPGGPRVVILSYGLWERRYGHDPALVGKQISLNNESYTVVGIMPADFYFPPFWRDTEAQLWVPGLDLSNPLRTYHEHIAIARLKAGVGLERAQVEMDTIARRIVQQSPDAKGWGVGLVGLREQAVGETRRPLMVLFGAVGFVLLIACANVANLMLARSAGRAREVAIRTALGADRGRLVRQLLTESLLLALLGGALGLVVAPWTIRVLAVISGEWVLDWWGGASLADVTVNGGVLAFTLIVTLATGMIAGLAPALGVSSPDLSRSLKEGGRGAGDGVHRHRLRSILVVSEFALALILLAGAGLMIRTLILMGRVDLGFNPHNVLTLRVPLLGPRYEDHQGNQAEFFTALTERVETLPGVQWASVSRGLPVEGWSGWGFVTEDNPSPPTNEEPDGNYQIIGPDYFRAMGIPLRQGRFFTTQDTQQSLRVVIVNEELARQQWPGQNPLGKHMKLNLSGKPWLTVVGVVGNVRTNWPAPEFLQEFYLPYMQYPWDLAPRDFIVRTALNPTAVAAAIQREVAALDKDQPVSDVRTLEDVVGEAVGPQRFALTLLGVFAVLALVLASVGIYGVMAYSVSQRIHEIGIRMALGAQRSNVLSMVVREALVLALIGAGLGLAGAWGLTRLLSGLLYSVQPTDPLTFALVPLLLVGVSAFASYIPAHRATRVDPIVALRYE
jgi:putative ABC transport system permease protein